MLEEKIYHTQVKTVLLYPKSEDPEAMTKVPILPIGYTNPLVLTFDVLNKSYENYYAKIVHCNADWRISNLNEIEYMQDFNETIIQQYEYSFNTKIPYVHYSLELPLTKISGNFAVVVYTENIEKPLFIKRFMVYENALSIVPNARPSTDISRLQTHQQIDFKIRYSGYSLINPRDNLQVVVRQNDRWDNALFSLKPTYIREIDRELEYVYFNGENNFWGLNVFRRFDLQSILFLGFNVAQLDVLGAENRARLVSDKLRNKDPFFVWNDRNGGFLINHFETQNGATQADYVKVYFTLKTEEALAGEVYLRGAFNQWQFLEEHKMSYYASEKAYQRSVLLKQGSYDYLYTVRYADGRVEDYFCEGSHFQTPNQYDILVYYRPLGARADALIGYRRFEYE
ncbi:MAG: DUF5103 domain-containing protein [Cytophagales bacterium]|nr:MAG: DUF5103 domain-containing protein [Cytophagales bacterium]